MEEDILESCTLSWRRLWRSHAYCHGEGYEWVMHFVMNEDMKESCMGVVYFVMDEVIKESLLLSWRRIWMKHTNCLGGGFEGVMLIVMEENMRWVMLIVMEENMRWVMRIVMKERIHAHCHGGGYEISHVHFMKEDIRGVMQMSWRSLGEESCTTHCHAITKIRVIRVSLTIENFRILSPSVKGYENFKKSFNFYLNKFILYILVA
jgi:hypothetical protein